MYHLIRSLYLHATSKEEYSVLLLGLDNAGKTTLLNQIKNLYQTSSTDSTAAIAAVHNEAAAEDHESEEPAADPRAGNTVPTVGQNVAVINQPDMYIKIWDVGGQMTLRRLWTSYYKSCHAVIFVVDSSDLGTLEHDIEDGVNEEDFGGDGNSGSDGSGGGASIGRNTSSSSLTASSASRADDGSGPVRGGGGGGSSSSRGGTIGRKWHGRRKSSYSVFAEDERGNGTKESALNASNENDEDKNNSSSSNGTDTTGTKTTATSSATHKPSSSISSQGIASSQVPARRPQHQRITSTSLDLHTGQGRLDECRAVLESVLGHPDTSGIPILVLANKQDREDCIEVVRIKEGFVRKVFEGDKGDLVRDSRVLPVSALKGTGVREAVEWVKKRVVGNKLGRAPVMR